MKKPIILIDVDGVLLKWQARVPQYCLEVGLDPTAALKMQNCEKVVNPFDGLVLDPMQEIRNYNESDHMYSLPAYEDALEFMLDNKHLYDFIAVTAQSKKPEAFEKRRVNLENVFGCSFLDVRTCDAAGDKWQMFNNIKYDYRERKILALIDDQAHNILSAYQVFGETIKLYHLIRGERVNSIVPCMIVSSLNQIQLPVSICGEVYVK